MCLLIFKPAGKIIPDEYLINASRSNPHGSGLAIATGDDIIIRKDPKWGSDEIIKQLAVYNDYPAIVHFRYATHGSKNEANTHPFRLNNEWVAAHNGVIAIDTLEDESDTRSFLRQHVIPFLDNGNQLTDKDIIEILSQEMGDHNKMTFLRKDGAFSIANEQSGHWHEGIWYSNCGYKSSYGHFSGDWYDEDDWETAYYNYQARKNNPDEYTRMPYYSAFGEIVEENDDDVSPILTLPERAQSRAELWLPMNNLEVKCNACGEEIWGPHAFEATHQMYVCEDCCKTLPKDLGLPSKLTC